METRIREAAKDDLQNIVKMWEKIMDYHSSLDPFFSRSQDGGVKFLGLITKELESESSNLLVAESEETFWDSLRCRFPIILLYFKGKGVE
ncbi:hypothetical protein CSA37_08900 [Candidatus Fermentibacteria bacterium]|nr:MAG: hypothetical protein CSA37_08900 [Candidatus Fermentibacteria bacterium]